MLVRGQGTAALDAVLRPCHHGMSETGLVADGSRVPLSQTFHG